MPNRYGASGDSTATAASADEVAANLWNPSSTKSIYVREVHCFSQTATACIPGLARTTSAGTTPAATVTPDVDSAFDHRIAPASGVLLYMGTYASTEPVVSTPYLTRAHLPAAVGAGMMWSFLDEPIEVLPGKGLAVATPVATILQACRITFFWDE